MTLVAAFPKTIPKQCDGIAWPPSRDMPRRSSFWGYMYSTGRGVPKDNTEAVRWYRMAAEQGLARAQCRLGGMYYTGEGIPKDYVQAYAWCDIAAAQGDKTAKGVLGNSDRCTVAC